MFDLKIINLEEIGIEKKCGIFSKYLTNFLVNIFSFLFFSWEQSRRVPAPYGLWNDINHKTISGTSVTKKNNVEKKHYNL
jgi:hypothetical protein